MKPRKPSGRQAILIAVVAAHVAVLALLLAVRFVPVWPPRADGALTVLSLPMPGEAEAPKAAEVAPPAPPIPVPAAPVPATIAAETAATADLPFDPASIPAAGDLATGSCDLSAAVQNRLSTDPEALAAIDAIPSAARSVANAVMLWDGRWNRVTPVAAGAPVGPMPETRIRWVVIAVVLSASDACRDADIRGPRLLPVQRPDGNAIMVFGSGAWRWRDVLDSLAPVDSPAGDAPPVSRAKSAKPH